MRLFEAIVDANHRALSGDPKAGLHLTDYAEELPLIALTCIDPRLNRLFPGALALPEDQFIWLRNAGNIIFGPTSTMMRSLALACAVKGGKEIAIIGHTDCGVRRISQAELLQKFAALGVPRDRFPGDLAEFLGIFTSEKDNVIRSADFVRHSPLIGPRIPVHGLIVDTATGKLDWLVNGYEALARTPSAGAAAPLADTAAGLAPLGDFKIGEWKMPEQVIGNATAKIGEITTKIGEAVTDWRQDIATAAQTGIPTPPPPPPAPPKAIPVPPPISRKSTHTGSWSERVKH